MIARKARTQPRCYGALRSAPDSSGTVRGDAKKWYVMEVSEPIVVHVTVLVKPEAVDAFRDATLVNARASVTEPGIARFDVLQDRDVPTRFVLVEIYRSADAPAAHKETEHYKRWRDTVADMMAEPRTSSKYLSVYPDMY
jgi:quinol monooxygenase YgiN